MKYAVYVVSEDWYLVSHRLKLVEACAQRGLRPIVITNVHRHRHVIEKIGARVIGSDLIRGGLNPFADFAYFILLFRTYRQVRPALVHHVALKPIIYGSIAARLAGVPQIVNELAGRGFLGKFSKERNPFIRFAGRVLSGIIGEILASPNAAIIVQNDDDRKFAIERLMIPEQNISFIPGVGADPELFHPKNRRRFDEKIVVTLVTRILWSKGVGEFVKAARILKARNLNVEFRLVGGRDQGNPDCVPESFLTRWVAQGLITYMGFSAEVAQVWADTDIAVLPTYYAEGVPKALLEAAMAGLPIVTTDRPGCNYVVEDRLNGILVPERDEQALARALIELIDSPSLRAAMGAAGRNRALEKFTSEMMIQKTLEVYCRRAGTLTVGRAKMTEGPRVVIAIPSITSYFTFLKELAESLEKGGYEVHIATSAKHLVGITCYGDIPAGQLHPIEFPRGANIFKAFRAAKELRALIRTCDPDIIHLHFSVTVFCAALVKQAWWPKTICTIHGAIFPQISGMRSRLFKAVERWSYGKMDALWLLTPDDCAAFAAFPRLSHKTFCYQSFGFGCRIDLFDRQGVSKEVLLATKQECKIAGEGTVFIFIGRCVYFKGFGVTVRSFFRLYEEDPSIKLIIVGEYDRLHRSGLSSSEERALTVHPGVAMIRWTANVARYLAVSDVNVFPSVKEGMPVNLMESLSMGVPVITLASRGCQDVVRDGIDGRVLPSPTMLAWKDQNDVVKVGSVLSAMQALNRDRAMRVHMTSGALQRRALFDRQIWIAEQEGIYVSLLTGREPQRSRGFGAAQNPVVEAHPLC